MKVKDCKLRKTLSCDKNTSVLEVAKKLEKNKEKHLIVTNSEKPVGIITTTDITYRLVAKNKDPRKTKAKDIMTSSILVKDIKEPLSKAYVQMLKNNVLSCSVTQKGKLKGILELKEAMGKLVKLKVK
jgi:CBS domain-containing protein